MRKYDSTDVFNPLNPSWTQEQIFKFLYSETYRRLLKRLARCILLRNDIDIAFLSPNDEAIAYTDGKIIYVNPSNGIFSVLKQITNFLLAVIAHEAFHGKYTNFPFWTKKIGSVSIDKQSLYKWMGNALCDARIERIGIIEFPGIEDYILNFRKHFFDTAKENDMHNDAQRLLNNILFFATCGKCKYKYDGQEAIDLWNGIENHIINARRADSTEAMFIELDLIFDKVWDFLKNESVFPENPTTMSKLGKGKGEKSKTGGKDNLQFPCDSGSSSSSNEDGQSDSSSRKSSKSSSSQNSSNKNESSNGNGSSANDENSNDSSDGNSSENSSGETSSNDDNQEENNGNSSNTSDTSDESDDKNKSDSEEPDDADDKSDDNNTSDDCDKSDDDTESKNDTSDNSDENDSENNAENDDGNDTGDDDFDDDDSFRKNSSFEDAADSDYDLIEEALNSCASEYRDEVQNNAADEKLSEELENSGDYSVTVNVAKATHSPVYNEILCKTGPITDSLVNTIKRLLNRNRVMTKHRLEKGVFDRQSLPYAYRGECFSKKILPKEVADLFVSIIVDCSGSMSGQRLTKTSLTSAIILEACCALKIPISIKGFSSSSANCNLTYFYDYRFKNTSNRSNITQIYASGGTPLANALSHEIKYLKKVPFKDKLVFVITDGEPDSTQSAILKVKELCKDAIVVGVAIGEDVPKLAKIFPNLVDGRDLDALPYQIGEIIKKNILK